MEVRLVNPTYDVRRRRVAQNPGGEGGFYMTKTRYVYRRSNPFSSGSINQLAMKVTGAIGGLVAASAVPAAIVPSMSSGWAGFGAALVVAFGGAWVLGKMSPNAAEGFLIGGDQQWALQRRQDANDPSPYVQPVLPGP